MPDVVVCTSRTQEGSKWFKELEREKIGQI